MWVNFFEYEVLEEQISVYIDSGEGWWRLMWEFLDLGNVPKWESEIEV